MPFSDLFTSASFCENETQTTTCPLGEKKKTSLTRPHRVGLGGLPSPGTGFHPRFPAPRNRPAPFESDPSSTSAGAWGVGTEEKEEEGGRSWAQAWWFKRQIWGGGKPKEKSSTALTR